MVPQQERHGNMKTRCYKVLAFIAYSPPCRLVETQHINYGGEEVRRGPVCSVPNDDPVDARPFIKRLVSNCGVKVALNSCSSEVKVIRTS